MDRPQKHIVLEEIEKCSIVGDFDLLKKSNIDYTYNGIGKGTFENKKFYNASTIIFTYVANILRGSKRTAIVKRDLQFYYIDDRVDCYRCAINPKYEEVFSDETSEIALVARGDGEGHFIYFIWDDIIRKDSEKKYCYKNKKVSHEKIITILKKYKTIFRVRIAEHEYTNIDGIKANDQKDSLQCYSDFLLLDKERTEKSEGYIEYFVPKTIRQIIQERQLKLIKKRQQVLKTTLLEMRQKEQQLIKSLGEPSNGNSS